MPTNPNPQNFSPTTAVLTALFASTTTVIVRDSLGFNLDSEAVQTYPGRNVLNNVELTSIIFAFLKNEASVKMSYSHGMRILPTAWKTQFAGWARVNRAFFEASTAVLWERMVSLVPFFLLLQPAEGEEGGEILAPFSYASGIPTSNWDRFLEYSSKTKFLTVYRQTSPQVSSAWALYLAAQNQCGRPLFPALDTLFLHSADDLSLHVAFSVIGRLSSLVIDFEDDDSSMETQFDACAGLTTLGQGSARFSHLTLVHPFSTDAVNNLTKLRSLTSLHLTFDHTMGLPVLSVIKQLHLLEELSLHQGGHGTTPHPFPEAIEPEPYLSRSTELPSLRALSVSANGIYHFMIATQLLPSSLVALSLHINVDPKTPYSHVLLVPPAITIYAARNLSLTRLDVTYPVHVDHGQNFNGIAHLRHNARLNATRPLLTALGALRNLTELRIERVPFLSREMVLDLIEASSKLPELRLLSLFPRNMPFEGASRLIWPSLQNLENLSRSCPSLTDLGMYVNIHGEIPEPPTDYVSVNGLCRLSLKSTETVEGPEFSLEVKLAMGRYLDRLFPRLESLAGYGSLKPVERAMWTDIQRIVTHFQELRAQAVQDLGGG